LCSKLYNIFHYVSAHKVEKEDDELRERNQVIRNRRESAIGVFIIKGSLLLIFRPRGT